MKNCCWCIGMFKFIKKARLVIIAGLAVVFGQIIIVFSLFGPCYNGCTVLSFFEFILEEFPVSLVILFLLTCAGLLHVIAFYLFGVALITKLRMHRWICILLTIATTPMLLLALYGLIFDSGDTIIYAPLALIALGLWALIWYPSLCKRSDKLTAHETLSN